MPKHLYALPSGSVLPTDVSDLPEGLPFVVVDDAGDLTFHALHDGAWKQLSGGGGGGGGGLVALTLHGTLPDNNGANADVPLTGGFSTYPVPVVIPEHAAGMVPVGYTLATEQELTHTAPIALSLTHGSKAGGAYAELSSWAGTGSAFHLPMIDYDRGTSSAAGTFPAQTPAATVAAGDIVFADIIVGDANAAQGGATGLVLTLYFGPA